MYTKETSAGTPARMILFLPEDVRAFWNSALLKANSPAVFIGITVRPVRFYEIPGQIAP